MTDCADFSAWVAKRADGAPTGLPVEGRHRVEAHVHKEGATWKVDGYISQVAGSC